MYDATLNTLAGPTGTAAYNTALTAIQASKGWYIDLKDTAAPIWRGEKGLARTTIFGGVLYVTTYEPAQSASLVACGAAAVGSGWLYEISLADGTGKGTGGSRRSAVGAGIPPEFVIVIRSDGTPKGYKGNPPRPHDTNKTSVKYKTYWYQE